MIRSRRNNKGNMRVSFSMGCSRVSGDWKEITEICMLETLNVVLEMGKVLCNMILVVIITGSGKTTLNQGREKQFGVMGIYMWVIGLMIRCMGKGFILTKKQETCIKDFGKMINSGVRALTHGKMGLHVAGTGFTRNSMVKENVFPVIKK